MRRALLMVVLNFLIIFFALVSLGAENEAAFNRCANCSLDFPVFHKQIKIVKKIFRIRIRGQLSKVTSD